VEVHGTVRSLGNPEKIAHLSQLAKERPDKLKLFEADLLKEGSFRKAAAGCDTIFHLASPFVPFKVRDPQAELIDPAVRGTANVLSAASATRSVSRVVLTSSVAAVMGDSVDRPLDEREMFSEDDWNRTSSITHQPYSYSKTLAEREAWRLAAEQEQWDLVVINPSFVLGPSLSERSDSTSTGMVIEFLKGSYKSGVPALSFGVVDVRDVAEAHLRAALKAGAEGRHIVSGPVLSMYEITELIGKAFPGRFPLPSKQLPKFLLYLFGPANGFTWKYVRRNIGIPFALDTGKSRRSLNMSYRPPAETIRDQVNRLLEYGLV
jgi:nucleoside-diphosphate-sugar epimerase